MTQFEKAMKKGPRFSVGQKVMVKGFTEEIETATILSAPKSARSKTYLLAFHSGEYVGRPQYMDDDKFSEFSLIEDARPLVMVYRGAWGGGVDLSTALMIHKQGWQCVHRMDVAPTKDEELIICGGMRCGCEGWR